MVVQYNLLAFGHFPIKGCSSTMFHLCGLFPLHAAASRPHDGACEASELLQTGTCLWHTQVVLPSNTSAGTAAKTYQFSQLCHVG